MVAWQETGGGGTGGGWRVAEVVLLIYDFLTFPNREGFRVYAEQRRGARGGLRDGKWRRDTAGF